MLFHRLIIDDVTDGGCNTTSNRYSRDGEFAHTGWKEEHVRGRKSLGEGMAGEGVGRDISKSWGGEVEMWICRTWIFQFKGGGSSFFVGSLFLFLFL